MHFSWDTTQNGTELWVPHFQAEAFSRLLFHKVKRIRLNNKYKSPILLLSLSKFKKQVTKVSAAGMT